MSAFSSLAGLSQAAITRGLPSGPVAILGNNLGPGSPSTPYRGGEDSASGPTFDVGKSALDDGFGFSGTGTGIAAAGTGSGSAGAGTGVGVSPEGRQAARGWANAFGRGGFIYGRSDATGLLRL
jgi:hypothetical protein